jgi:pimeloyl-ACP methyl ester carboxylesterase
MLAGGAELYVAPATGEGEPLVLVHGGWTDHNTWAALVEPLARSFRVTRYDRRGHSRSPRGAEPPARRVHEDDLAAIIEASGCGPVHLLGTSYGAAISLALAGRRPELVRSVVAHEPPLVGIVPVPGIKALFAGVAEQIGAGDVARATKRFFEELILGPGGWERHLR